MLNSLVDPTKPDNPEILALAAAREADEILRNAPRLLPDEAAPAHDRVRQLLRDLMRACRRVNLSAPAAEAVDVAKDRLIDAGNAVFKRWKAFASAAHGRALAGSATELDWRTLESLDPAARRRIGGVRAAAEALEALPSCATLDQAQPHLATLNATGFSAAAEKWRGLVAKREALEDSVAALRREGMTLAAAAPHLKALEGAGFADVAKGERELLLARSFDHRKLGIPPVTVRRDPAPLLTKYRAMPPGPERDEFRKRHFLELLNAESSQS